MLDENAKEMTSLPRKSNLTCRCVAMDASVTLLCSWNSGFYALRYIAYLNLPIILYCSILLHITYYSRIIQQMSLFQPSHV
jgi:hypothetical protein